MSISKIYLEPKYHNSNHLPPIPEYLKNKKNVIQCRNNEKQLFVDNYLIESTKNISYKQHQPEILGEVVKPEHEFEGCATAPLPDAVIYDPLNKEYIMWFISNVVPPHTLCIAKSKDGINWYKPHINKPIEHFDICCENCKKDKPKNKNIIATFGGCRNGKGRGSGSIILDPKEKDIDKRFKLLIGGCRNMSIFYSSDGINWKYSQQGGSIGGSPWFLTYNPWKDKYVFLMRDNLPHVKMNRVYRYKEVDTIDEKWNQWYDKKGYGAAGYKKWKPQDPIIWAVSDKLDTMVNKEGNRITGIYSASMIHYESIMLCLFSVFRGGLKWKKNIDLYLGFSRDGFEYTRPEPRKPFIAENPKNNLNYITIIGNCVIPRDNDLLVYFTAKKYTESKYIMSTYASKLRKDGFISANSKNGIITTKLLSFENDELYVNINGDLYVELLDKDNKIIDGFSKMDFIIIKGNTIRGKCQWKNNDKLPINKHKSFKLRMYLSGDIYSFWVENSKVEIKTQPKISKSCNYVQYISGKNMYIENLGFTCNQILEINNNIIATNNGKYQLKINKDIKDIKLI